MFPPSSTPAIPKLPLEADETGVIEETRRLLAEGMGPHEILESGMAAAMAELGQRWNRGEAFLPGQEHRGSDDEDGRL
ncbi:MAG: B12-binding domain-containing protein [Bacillota bacterium]